MQGARITRLCLVRHGETAWNAEGRVQGQTDVPLSAAGAGQARALADALDGNGFAAIYASDLTRARQTAGPAAERFALEVRIDAALRERHYGVFETLTYVEAKARFPEDYARFKRRDPAYDFRGGESLAAFQARTLGCLETIAARHAGEAVLVVTHGGVLEMAYRHATGRPLSTPRDFEIPNAALNWIEANGAEWHVRAWADRAHLDAGAA